MLKDFAFYYLLGLD